MIAKPLVWEDQSPTMANAGSYVVGRGHKGRHHWWAAYDDDGALGRLGKKFDTADAAKAACEVDWQESVARMLAPLIRVFLRNDLVERRNEILDGDSTVAYDDAIALLDRIAAEDGT